MPSATKPAAVPPPQPFRRALMAWYRRKARPLPWREAPSLYGTVVSEFMLQQTQVATVLPYFRRWMRELPGFDALAAAPEDRVAGLWAGLGYYGRARNLHRLARALAAPGSPPRTAAAWQELPGVGPYTAAAIASIALGERIACVDGNVVRILARLTGTAELFRDGAAGVRALAPAAAALVPGANPGDHNQAMMELGATVCLRGSPRCGECPVRAFCAAARAGTAASLPRFEPRKTVRLRVARVWCERRGRLLLHRADHGSRRLAGIHELPTAAQAGVADGRGRLLGRRTRSITKYRVAETIREAPAPRGRPGPGLRWVPLSSLGSIALSGPHRRWIREILAARGPGRSAPGRGPSTG